ncbi:MAG: alpha/beta hydrolase [Motiliproteus sp.]
MSIQNFFLKKYLRYQYKPRFNEQLDLQQVRIELDSVINTYMPPPCGFLDIRQEIIGGVSCECITPKRGRAKGTFFYLHGGMFVMGSPLSHRGVTCVLANELNLNVVVPTYRLAPEHPFPAAVDDVWAAYQGLIAESCHPAPLIVGGDQCGAGLAMILGLALRDAGERLPDALVGVSGFYDLTLTSESMARNSEADCCCTLTAFRRGIGYYLSDPALAARPEVSPLFASLDGLPPVLLQVSDTEMLLDDSRNLARALEKAGGQVCLDVWEDVPSCWHIAAVGLPEGRSAIKRIGKFLNNTLANSERIAS